MQKKIKELTEEDKMLLEDESEVIMNPILLTDASEAHLERNSMYFLQLLYLNYDAGLTKEQKQKNKFYVKLQVYKTDPEDPRDIVKAMC